MNYKNNIILKKTDDNLFQKVTRSQYISRNVFSQDIANSVNLVSTLA